MYGGGSSLLVDSQPKSIRLRYDRITQRQNRHRESLGASSRSVTANIPSILPGHAQQALLPMCAPSRHCTVSSHIMLFVVTYICIFLNTYTFTLGIWNIHFQLHCFFESDSGCPLLLTVPSQSGTPRLSSCLPAVTSSFSQTHPSWLTWSET